MLRLRFGMLTRKAVLGVAVGMGIESISGLKAQVGAEVGLKSMSHSGSGVADAIGRRVPVGVAVVSTAAIPAAEALSWAVLVGEREAVSATTAGVAGRGEVVIVGEGVEVGVVDGAGDISGAGASLGPRSAMDVGGGVAEPGRACSPGT
jgi:hypothetical protein